MLWDCFYGLVVGGYFCGVWGCGIGVGVGVGWLGMNGWVGGLVRIYLLSD